MNKDTHLWQIAWVRDLATFMAFVGIIYVGYTLRSIFTPVIIALILAYLFDPLIDYMQEKFKLPRTVSIGLILLMIGLAIILFVIWLGPIVFEQVTSLLWNLPIYFERLTENYSIDLGSFKEQMNTIAEKVRQDPLSILSGVFAGTGHAFGFIGDILGTATYISATLILIPVYFFFFAWRFDDMTAWIASYFPRQRRDHMMGILGKMDRAVSSFFRGRLIIALIMGAMFSFGWMLAGVPYWFLLGMFTGMLSLIPFAAGVGVPIAIAVKYLDSSGSFDWMAVLLWPILVYAIVQVIEGWLLTPWIQSQSSDMNPITIVIIVMIGGSLAGLYGLLLAIPLSSCVKILVQEVWLPQLKHWAAEN